MRPRADRLTMKHPRQIAWTCRAAGLSGTQLEHLGMTMRLLQVAMISASLLVTATSATATTKDLAVTTTLPNLGRHYAAKAPLPPTGAPQRRRALVEGLR